MVRTGQAFIADVSRSWSELYAEARADFEASHPRTTNAVWVNGERVDDIVQPRAQPQRDSRGRFVKQTES
jgi:hypothetical protein